MAELRDMLQTAGVEMDPSDLEKIVAEYDLDESGAVDFDEFVSIFVRILARDELGDSSQAPIEIGEESLHRRPKNTYIPGKEFRYDVGIDWLKLRAYINDTHPRELVDTDSDGEEDDEESGQQEKERKPRSKMKVKFNCCLANLGQLGLGQAARRLTLIEEEIGPGLTIYFRQLKLYMIVFLLFTIMTIP